MKFFLTDVDETILDWINPFTDLLRARGHNPPPWNNHRFYHWFDISKEEVLSLVAEFNKSESFKKLKPYDHTKYLWSIAALGFKFVAITSCGTDPNVAKARKDHINNLFPGLFEDVICLGWDTSKGEILAKFEPTYWVDDNPYWCNMGIENNHETFIVDHGFNTKNIDPRLNVIRSWGEIFNHIVVEGSTSHA